MKYLGNYKLLKTKITACDHQFILKKISEHIIKKKFFLISPLASQTFVLAYFDNKLKLILDKYDYLFSDSIWVKRTLNFLYNVGLQYRLRGSNLLLQTCELAQKKNYRIYLYGTTADTLLKLKIKLKSLFPTLNIVGYFPSVFRPVTLTEKKELIDEIENKKTQILFLSLGSPLEQIFAYDLINTYPKLNKPIIIIPFGAAFDFTSGVKAVAPLWMQRTGFEWFFRFISEPKRLWKRYLLFGPVYSLLVINQKFNLLLYGRYNKIIKRKRLGKNI